MSEKREYTLQLVQAESGRTQSVHVTQGAKAVTPPPEPPKPEEKIVFDADPNPISMKWYERDGNMNIHRFYMSVDVTIRSYKEVDGVKTPLPVSCTISPSDAPEYLPKEGATGSDGTYTIQVHRDNENSSDTHKPSGSLVITQEATGETITIPIETHKREEV
jgi:hypothetical protein